MYQDYLDAIVNYYWAGQRNADLPQRLMHPTPGRIKDECIAACKTRFDQKDLRTLTAFFAEEKEPDAMLKAIWRCDRDRFRPLVNFLKRDSNATDPLNIELLGWLINFPHRPFYAGLPYDTLDIVNDIRNNSVTTGTEEEAIGYNETPVEDLTGGQKTESRRYKRFGFLGMPQKVLVAILGILLLTLAGFYTQVNKKTALPVDNSESRKSTTGPDAHDLPLATLFIPLGKVEVPPYSRCTGNAPCTACSNCLYCNWCNSGGVCGKCMSAPKKKITQKRTHQCEAITKKGTQCSRAAKAGSKYCWQHG